MIIKDTYYSKKLKEIPVFDVISKAADSLQQKAFVVGGFVRDLIMERDSNDIDIVTIGEGIELAKEVAKLLNINQKIKVFKNFGTAMFFYENGGKTWELEFVGARKESYRKNSRKPIVENGSLEDDQNRRDFTINALAICLNKEGFGEMIDSFGGISDIANKCIKTPLDADITYSDDPLRMMRAIRFATQLGFAIEKESFASIQKNKHRIEIVSKERIADELNKIVLSNKPSEGFILLSESGLLEIIFPQLEALKGVEEVNGQKHKDNFYHTLQVLDNISEKSDNFWLRWAALLHDIAKPNTKKYIDGVGWAFHGHEYIGSKMVYRIFKRLRLPLNDKMKYVQKLVRLHLRPQALIDDIVTDSAIRRLLFDAGDDVNDLMTLCEADITSKNQRKIKTYLKNFAIVREKLIEIEEKDKLRNWQPPISGEIIMETFQIKPSKEVGLIKTAIREGILDGKIHNNYEEAFQYMLEEGKRLGLEICK